MRKVAGREHTTEMPNALVQVTDNMDAGLVIDLPSIKLVPSAWTDTLNMSFDNGVARKAKGHDKVITPLIAPYFIMPAPSLEQEFWLYAGLTKVRGFLGATQGDITRVSGDYTGGITDRWNGGVFNAIPFINNGKDIPQAWTTIGLANPLVDMPGWPTTQRARVVRAFKAFLVALDVTKAGVQDGRMIKWSTDAPPGSLPGSWDETDATKNAGEFTLSEGSDGLIDCAELRDSNIIYTKRSIWAMEFIGGEFVFRFRKLFADTGLLAQDCMIEFQNRHFVVTQSDIVVHDGTTVQSVVDARVRRDFFKTLNDSAADLTTVIENPIDNEIWVCYASGTSFNLNRALVWNWKFDSWTKRELPDIRAIGTSVRNPFVSQDIWDLDTGNWDTDTTPWEGEGIDTSALENVLVMSPPDLTGIVLVGNSFTFSGNAYTSYLERRGITLVATAGTDFAPIRETRQNRILQDPDRHKLGLGIRPIVEANSGVKLSVRLGSHDTLAGPINWKGPTAFVVGKDKKVDLYPSGKFLALRIEDKGTVDWRLLGYVLEVSPLGRY